MEQTRIKPEIVDPIELVTRVHRQLAYLASGAITLDSPLVAEAYRMADNILIRELQTMLDEASVRILEKR